MLCKTPHTAIDVMHRSGKPPLCHSGEHGIAPPAVEKRHRSGCNRTAANRQPAALNQVIAVAKAFHKAGDLEKVVTIIGIAHDDVLSARSGDSSHQGTAITF